MLESPLTERALAELLTGPLVDAAARDIAGHGENAFGETVRDAGAQQLLGDPLDDRGASAEHVAERIVEGPRLLRRRARVEPSPAGATGHR